MLEKMKDSLERVHNFWYGQNRQGEKEKPCAIMQVG